jgi:F-type H+-transporting ATPase subunit delta
MAGIRDVLAEQPSFAAYLADPGIGGTERTATLEKVFKGRVSPLVSNFLGVVNNHGRMRMLGPIAQAFVDLLDEQRGNVEVDVTVAQRLSADQLEQVRQRVSQALGKNAVVHQYVDEDIIGGLVLRVEDRLIDASVKYQLEAMRERLLAARKR